MVSSFFSLSCCLHIVYVGLQQCLQGVKQCFDAIYIIFLWGLHSKYLAFHVCNICFSCIVSICLLFKVLILLSVLYSCQVSSPDRGLERKGMPVPSFLHPGPPLPPPSSQLPSSLPSPPLFLLMPPILPSPSVLAPYSMALCQFLESREEHTALHCTALHCTALHCTALHCTALHFTALQVNWAQCPANIFLLY